MKFSHCQTKTHSAFTLVELLVVITIIIALIGMGVATLQTVRKQALKLQATNSLTQMSHGVDSFFSDYGYLPQPKGTNTSEDTTGNTKDNTDIISILYGLNEEINPKKNNYIQMPLVKGYGAAAKNGILKTKNNAALFDPWGEGYGFVLDTNYDEEITNPFPNPETINGLRFIAWSKGPDKSAQPLSSKKGSVNRDNVYSY